jgi:hypothetical protein
MRARQFILEYNQQATAQRFGDKLLQAAVKDPSPEIYQVYSMLNDRKEFKDFNLTPNTKTNVLITIMQAIEAADPTKNKEYTVFLAKMYAQGGWGARIEDLESKVKPALEKFHLLKLKKKIPSPRNDIMRYTDLADFVAVMDEYPDPEEKKQVDKGQAETVFENDKVRIVIPRDQNAACYYGQGTRWCTASKTSTNYYNSYSKDGDLYILLPKQPKYDGEKYQLHFSSGQFMNEEDYQVDDIVELLDMRFGNLVDFFREREPQINDWLVFTPDEMLEPLIGKIKTAVSDHVDEIVNDWEHQDDYWWDYLRKEGYVYPEGHEEEGQIDWDKVAEADLTYTDWNYDAADYINRIVGAVDLTPQEVRDLAVEVGREWGNDEQGIDDLDKILAYAIEQTNNRNEGDGGVAEWLHDHLYVKKRDGQWDVSLLYTQKDGQRKEYEIR